MNVGDRVVWLGRGGIVWYMPEEEDASIMIVMDDPFDGGHSGSGGCKSYSVPKLPQFKGRCWWLGESEVELQGTVVAKAEEVVEL